MKRWLALSLKFAISAALIAYFLQAIDLYEVSARVAAASLGLLLISTLVLSLQFLVATARWQAVLQAFEVPMRFRTALRLTFIGAFFNQTLPSSAGGDAIRIYKAYKAGLPLASSVNGVMLERLATVLGLLVLVLACQPFFLTRSGANIPVWLFPGIAVAGTLGTGLLMSLDRLPVQWCRWKVMRGATYLARDTRCVFLRPSHALRTLSLGVVGHVNISLATWLLCLALGLGESVTLLDCLVLIPVVLLVTTLPISIAGWGVREASMVAAFAMIGVPEQSAVLVSVLFGLQTLVVSLPGGLVWLLSPEHGEVTSEPQPDED